MNFIRTCALALLCSFTLLSAVEKTGGIVNNLAGGLAVGGYDVVAYLNVRTAISGSPEHTYNYQGATWRFASAEHRRLFAGNPERYAPQFGGFCSFGCSVGQLFQVDPVNGWLIHDNKLYLNLNADIKELLNKELKGNIEKANSNWPKLNIK
jgi:YHS domain-containing protein